MDRVKGEEYCMIWEVKMISMKRKMRYRFFNDCVSSLIRGIRSSD